MSTATTTTAIASLQPGEVDSPDAFAEIELPLPPLPASDLLVEVKAVSVNPVDYKLRQSFDPGDGPKVLGFDAAGIVREVGAGVSGFGVGDEVYYSGSSLTRPGTNSRLQQVESRVAAHKPSGLDFAEAAALPLTAMTAWECLFDRLGLDADSDGTLLVVGGAGGVGSMITQLARARTSVTVIATAGRPESAQWAREMGAHHVVGRDDLVAAVRAVAPDGVDYVFSANSEGNVEAYAELLPVHGAVVAIDDPAGLDLMPLKPKSQSWLWEFLYSRPVEDPADDHHAVMLRAITELVDAGLVRSTMTTRLGPLDVDTLREAHRRIESGSVIGKVVIGLE